MKSVQLLFVILIHSLFTSSGIGQEVVKVFNEGLTVPLHGSYGREAVFTDEFWYRYSIDSIGIIAEGEVFANSKDGEEIVWEKISADDKDWFRHKNLRGGYVVFEFVSKKKQSLILEANGHSEVWVNEALRGGDIYGFGWIQHPIQIKKGKNRLVFRVGRGRLQAKLLEPEADVFITPKDLLMPDLIKGDSAVRLGAVRLINASNKEISGFKIESSLDGVYSRSTDIPLIPPFSSRKVAFEVKWTESLKEKSSLLLLEVLDDKTKMVFSLIDDDLRINIKEKKSKHKETFISGIDGSVQYYSVVPPINGSEDSLALFFSLHGASVEAVNQANAYKAKDWGTLVAPTNRRPYGFDWEDWGRMDAEEVLKLAIEKFNPDPAKLYLTGHSMGGHGTWHFGVTFPGYWAAIAPSAGWYSFWSYGGKDKSAGTDEIGQLINRASQASNTIGLSRNYLQYGIYILHGDEDDNVPVSQARYMREQLGAYHPDFTYYERPGAGHWWGNECVDWPPMFEYFRIHQRPKADEILTQEFYTASPGVSSSSGILNILQQNIPLKVSSAVYKNNLKQKRIEISFENTKSFMLDMSGFDQNQPYEIILDSTALKMKADNNGKKYFNLTNNVWSLGQKPDAGEKNPNRNGLFKYAFRNKMIFVYGTSGNKEENKWAFNKARFDAETFWYRGNGAIEIISDKDYSREKYPDSNVILFGNEDINSAWNIVLDNCPIKVKTGKISIGDKEVFGDDIGIYFTYPLAGSDLNSVGVIAGTGMPGLRAASQNRYFVSGSGFPDFLIFETSMLREGIDGVIGAGYFDNSWNLDKADYKIR